MILRVAYVRSRNYKTNLSYWGCSWSYPGTCHTISRCTFTRGATVGAPVVWIAFVWKLCFFFIPKKLDKKSPKFQSPFIQWSLEGTKSSFIINNARGCFRLVRSQPLWDVENTWGALFQTTNTFCTQFNTAQFCYLFVCQCKNSYITLGFQTPIPEFGSFKGMFLGFKGISETVWVCLEA